jgi:hypothetical protein
MIKSSWSELISLVQQAYDVLKFDQAGCRAEQGPYAPAAVLHRSRQAPVRVRRSGMACAPGSVWMSDRTLPQSGPTFVHAASGMSNQTLVVGGGTFETHQIDQMLLSRSSWGKKYPSASLSRHCPRLWKTTGLAMLYLPQAPVFARRSMLPGLL